MAGQDPPAARKRWAVGVWRPPPPLSSVAFRHESTVGHTVAYRDSPRLPPGARIGRELARPHAWET